MNILFLTVSRIDTVDSHGIYSDLMRELAGMGNDVYIATPLERRYGGKTHVISTGNVKILKVKTLNIQKTNVIEKGIGTLLLETQFLKAINKFWGDVRFDLILYTTPPITFNKVISSLKKKYEARTYLLLKDIFPQNAVDLGMFPANSRLYKMFRKKEMKLYSLSDKIGCMSRANKEYLVKENPELSEDKIEIFPNSVTPLPYTQRSDDERKTILESLGIDPAKVVSLYGGNIGKPQGLDFILKVLESNENRKNHHIVIVGNGTEFGKLQDWIETRSPKNVTLLGAVPQSEYVRLSQAADIGLVFLDHRFTIPNYPSRIISYMECAIPLMLATDVNSDVGTDAMNGGYGLWSRSDDLAGFDRQFDRLIADADLRREMGLKGRRHVEEHLDIRAHIPKLFN